MIGLQKSLLAHELIVLRTIGEWWELELTGMDRPQCAAALAERLQLLDMRQELLFLQPEEAAALRELIAAGGRVPASTFSRTYGEVRQMGPGALERDEPWLDPQSPVEALWYRGFVYQGFDEASEGVVEFFYLPDELLALFPSEETEIKTETELEKEVKIEPSERVPDVFEGARHDAAATMTSLLALAQAGIGEARSERADLLWTIAHDVGWLGDGRVKRAAVTWLQLRENEALQAIWQGWLSSTWNALRHTPQLRCEGSNWTNDATAPRRVLLDYLPRASAWVQTEPLIQSIKQNEPDFQRPNGNYDGWYIRDEATDGFLAGFESWDQVEGRLLHFVLTGPMHWLGMIDVGDGVIRPTPNLLAWLDERPLLVPNVDLPIMVQPNGSIVVPMEASRYHRFQLMRVAELQPTEAGKPWVFRVSPRSLKQAQAQGIAPQRVLSFLEEVAGRPIPVSTRRAIERWGEQGTEGTIEQTVILRVGDADIIDKLHQNAKTRPFIGERLGELAVVVRGDAADFRQIVAQLGLLLGSKEEKAEHGN